MSDEAPSDATAQPPIEASDAAALDSAAVKIQALQRGRQGRARAAQVRGERGQTQATAEDADAAGVDDTPQTDADADADGPSGDGVEAKDDADEEAHEQAPAGAGATDADADANTNTARAAPPPPVAAPSVPSARAASTHAATTDVVAVYLGHAFSSADVQDVVKVQSAYRRHQADIRVAESRAKHAAQRQAAAAAAVASLTPIGLPELDAASLGFDVGGSGAAGAGAAAAAVDRGPAKDPRAKFGGIDLGRLRVSAMSGDAQGMQSLYTHMLQTKMWW